MNNEFLAESEHSVSFSFAEYPMHQPVKLLRLLA